MGQPAAAATFRAARNERKTVAEAVVCVWTSNEDFYKACNRALVWDRDDKQHPHALDAARAAAVQLPRAPVA